MTTGEFRCAFFARDFDSTVTFYRDDLGLPIVEEWNYWPDIQGAIFGAASGLIEVQKLPQNQEPNAVWDYSKPHGIMLVIESDDVEAWYKRSLDKGLSIREGLTNQPWGHRTFLMNDPNGVTLYIYSKIG